MAKDTTNGGGTDLYGVSGTSPPEDGTLEVTTAPEELGKRSCTRCNLEKPLCEYYKKGARWDSWCKGCKVSKRKATYTAKRQVNSLAALKQVAEILHRNDLKVLDQFNQKLLEMLKKCQK